MPFKTPNKTSEYIRNLLKPETDPLFKEMRTYADAQMIPILLPETEAFLKQLMILKKPLKILEIGTAIGYSGLVMLNASCLNSTLVTIEVNDDYADRARHNFELAGVKERVTLFIGSAGEILPLYAGSFDFIFVDGPKAQYSGYLPDLLRLLENGGVLLCDNILYNGMVAGEADPGKKRGLVARLDEFLVKLFDTPNISSSILPVGDGLSLSLKD